MPSSSSSSQRHLLKMGSGTALKLTRTGFTAEPDTTEPDPAPPAMPKQHSPQEGKRLRQSTNSKRTMGGPNDYAQRVTMAKEGRKEMGKNTFKTLRKASVSSVCHQCRRRTPREKMQCTALKDSGEQCGLRYCAPCIALRCALTPVPTNPAQRLMAYLQVSRNHICPTRGRVSLSTLSEYLQLQRV